MSSEDLRQDEEYYRTLPDKTLLEQLGNGREIMGEMYGVIEAEARRRNLIPAAGEALRQYVTSVPGAACVLLLSQILGIVIFESFFFLFRIPVYAGVQIVKYRQSPPGSLICGLMVMFFYAVVFYSTSAASWEFLTKRDWAQGLGVTNAFEALKVVLALALGVIAILFLFGVYPFFRQPHSPVITLVFLAANGLLMRLFYRSSNNEERPAPARKPLGMFLTLLMSLGFFLIVYFVGDPELFALGGIFSLVFAGIFAVGLLIKA